MSIKYDIYNLINGAKYYFLSRPQRFGKSLLLNTAGEVFNGDKNEDEMILVAGDGDYVPAVLNITKRGIRVAVWF